MIRFPMPPRSAPIKRATTIRASGKRKAGCDCETCQPNVFGSAMRMIVCAICGNKRCPHANDHRNGCTGSNAVGQPGSSWAHVKPIAKRMKSSRSTGNPTKAESSRIDTIKRMECLACRHNRITRTRPSAKFDGCDAHHLLSGGRRIGHAATIGLCPWHHRAVKPERFEWMGIGGCIDAFGPSVATGSRAFHDTYGSDAELLALQNELIKGAK